MPLLDVIVGYDCNLYCDYCTISPSMRERSLTTRAIVAALEQGRGDGFERVSFTGGEPTIRSDLLGLVRTARRLGYLDVKLQTNGLLLSVPENLSRILEAGVTRVHLSIHTHRPDRYDVLVRRAGTYDAMVQGLEAVAARDVELVAEVILKADTYEDLPETIEWLHQRGVKRADLWFVSLTDHNADNLDSMPPMTEVVPSMHAGLARARALDMTVRSLHVPRCLLGDDHRHAWDPASQGVRVVTPEATFDLAASKLTGHLHVPACEGCEFEAICPGIREDYLARFGDAEIAGARGRATTVGPRRGLPIVEER